MKCSSVFLNNFAMKSAFELAMERLEKESPTQELTDEQKAGVTEQRALTLAFNKATIGLLSEEQRTKAGVKLPGGKKKKTQTK